MPTKSSSNAGSSAALGAGYLAAGAGSGVLCTPEDESFTCQLKRTVSTVQGVIFLLLVLYLVYFVFMNRKTIFK